MAVSEIAEISKNIPKTSVIAVAVAEYGNLTNLPGVTHDKKLADEIFSEKESVALYKNNYQSLSNPTAERFRKAITDYSFSRSDRGDILILYFSGHGAILGKNDFSFCLKDTAVSFDKSTILSTSVVQFTDVVQSLSSADVYPVFILDACFSSATAPRGTDSFPRELSSSLDMYFRNNYALLASSSIESQTFDLAFGGVFTRALHSIISNGMGDDKGRHTPFLTLNVLSSHLQARLAKDKWPLSRSHIGADMPQVPIARNAKYRPDTERFSPYMNRIVEYIWNSGSPRQVTLDELLSHVGPGAYANHSKLSYAPWGLLEDGDLRSTRRLTRRGIQFAQGELSVPKEIIKDYITWEWIAAPGTKEITFKIKRKV